MSTPTVSCAFEHCRCLAERIEPTDDPFDEDDVGLGEPLDELTAETFCSPSCRREADQTDAEPSCHCGHPECDAADA